MNRARMVAGFVVRGLLWAVWLYAATVPPAPI